MGVTLIVVAASYLAGSVPFGLILIRLIRGVDIRTQGSGNIGTVNVFRVGGPLLATTVLALDAGKGYLGPWIAGQLGLPAWAAVLAAVAAIAGHNWSIFLGLRGGKGVATTLGAMLALAPKPVLWGAVVWLAVVGATGFASLGSILGTLAVDAILLALPYDRSIQAFGLVAAALVILRHRSNIGRLLRGQELRLWRRNDSAQGKP